MLPGGGLHRQAGIVLVMRNLPGNGSPWLACGHERVGLCEECVSLLLSRKVNMPAIFFFVFKEVIFVLFSYVNDIGEEGVNKHTSHMH